MASVSNSRLFGEGAGAGFVGGAVATVVWLGATTAGVPAVVRIPNLGVAPVEWFQFVGAGIAAGLGAALVALLVDGRRSSRRLFTAIAVVALVLSGAPLLQQPDEVALSTLLVLAATHVVVYFAVVPRLASRLRTR
jgi:hypothetical protein